MRRSLLTRAALRFYLKHPWQLCLAIAGIGLGVAVYVGVALANDSARKAFDVSADTVLGQTTHQLMPLEDGLPEMLYPELVLERGIALAAPIVEGEVELAAQTRRELTLLGVDPLQERSFRGFSALASTASSVSSDIADLIVEPNTVLVPDALAAELGLERGAALEVRIDGTIHALKVAGIIRGRTSGDSSEAPLVTDISTAQELLDMEGTISRIDLILTDDQARELRSSLPPATTLMTAARQDPGFAQLTSAFRVNLTALSLLALAVGVFLIYATMSFAIVQRRSVMGTLRALGVSRRELAGTVLLEAAVLGTVATVIGVLLGRVLATGLVDLVLHTIDDLYFASSVTAATPSPAIYLQGAALGVLATIGAALGPALDAARTSPRTVMGRAALERSARRRSVAAALLAVALAGFGAILLGIDSRSLYLAFAALFIVLASGALLTPLATAGQMKLIEPAATLGFGLPGSLAVRGVGASLSRTGVAAAALTVAVATVIGIGTMIVSFRASLVEWLDTTLLADVYLTDMSRGADAALSASLRERIEALPNVAGMSLTRFVRLPTAHGRLGVRAIQPGPDGWGVTLVDADKRALAEMTSGAGVLIAETLAYRLELGAGDSITLPTTGGPRVFAVLGVFHNYDSEGAGILMPLSVYRRYWNDSKLSGIGVYLSEPAASASTVAAIESMLGPQTGIRVRANTAIREMSLSVFDRTFRITEVLRALTGLVAFLGILSALLSIQLERARDIAVLRAMGFTPRQVTTLSLAQTGLLGLAAGVLALPVGTILASLLVFVINKRSFGWSMDFVVTPEPLLLGLGVAISAALLAGVYPAWRAGRMQPASQLRSE